ncbi:Sulfur carrier protein CysO [Thalassoglobus neptunius]|uniref:Sulfur carrier protein CysO n=1 Tax=Thalassoglobus neptunius TaxID=1938619 RepID=A0A5C5X8M2_9PLAN|nr:MoaD/ThiS family protein [Thalassoglobus neptunius]TWT59069.1 Sulfur carrier protein CysO [Thalassoglobus neptunius]
MATVFIPTSLRSLSGGVRSIQANASNVREVIDHLEEHFPGMRDRLCENGELRKGIAVAVDSRVCSHGLLEKISPDSEVHFVPGVSGG